MAQMHEAGNGESDWGQLREQLGDLYQGGFLDRGGHQNAKAAQEAASLNVVVGPKGYDPSVAIPQIILYLRDNDASRDVNWHQRFPLIQAYLEEAHRQMKTGGLGFSDPDLRAALEDARVMVKVHQNLDKRTQEKTRWTTDILRGQTTQERLLTYPKAFPPPNPNRSKSQYRPVKPMPRPGNTTALWNTSLHIVSNTANVSKLTELDNYVDSENKFFKAIQRYARTGEKEEITSQNGRFATDNAAFEHYIGLGLAETCSGAPPPHSNGPTGPVGPDNPDGTKGQSFYKRRGWQRAALQQCLNLFTNDENRVINTPWRRPVLPYQVFAPLPGDIAFVPRLVDPNAIVSEKDKDPFSWLLWSSQYTQTVDFLAGCQRRVYNNQVWNNLSASALPANFRGPNIYRGLAVYDQHMLKIGHYLETLESMLHDAWGAAPRPFLRAILRDIDAGRQGSTGSLNLANRQYPLGEDDDDMLQKNRYWRRDIRRRPYVDFEGQDSDEENYKLVNEHDILWLRYLCDPSRTLEMCDPSKLPSHNLATLFDARLQSYFRDRGESSTPDSKALYIWNETPDELDQVMRNYKPSTVIKALAYINGCRESEVIVSGNPDAHPEQPNACYQFSLEEAEFLCVELEMLGRCVFTPSRNGRPSTVDRPNYNVHPEDRVVWRYIHAGQFHQANQQYLHDMLGHYHRSYGSWPMYQPNRLRFSRELEFMLDHAGPDFPYELERVETQDKKATTENIPKQRWPLIKKHLVPEGLCRIGDSAVDDIEIERDSPFWEDLATWEEVGAQVAEYREQQKQRKDATAPYRHDIYQPQTPERTAQFFRNLAYRMGLTMRHVDLIKERLQYLDSGPPPWSPKPALDLSADVKEPRLEDAPIVQGPVVAEKWWHAISTKDYHLATEKWNTAVQEGSSELALLPPDIDTVLEMADPDASFRKTLKDNNPFTIIREGIIDDCVQNRPAMYPGRLSGFKDQNNKEFQGLERPNLFEWATKDQRRFQAQYTRRDFFNMQRWPPCRILPHRLEAIRSRKDEILRTDPSKDNQTYGILSYRLPVGKEKPLYAHAVVDHHYPDNLDLLMRQQQDQVPDPDQNLAGALAAPSHGNTNDGENKNGNGNGADNNNNNNNNNNNDDDDDNSPDNRNNNGTDNIDNNNMNDGNNHSTRPRGGHIPYQRSREKFAAGPAVFPMGDTLLQKVLISHELSNALYPRLPFYKQNLLGLPKAWQKIAGARIPLVPLVPPVSRSLIPRSLGRKRKMPIEFLNSTGTAKRFRSDVTVPLQPGGNGGQFAAAIEAVKVPAPTTRGDSPAVRADTTSPELPQSPVSETALPPPRRVGKTAHSLPKYEDPCRDRAFKQFQKNFPYGWDSGNVVSPHLVSSAMTALAFSINRQLQHHKNLQTDAHELQALLSQSECAALDTYTDTATNNFDVHCVNLLLQVFGEKHGVKLQLGLVQEDPARASKYILPGPYPKKSEPFLVGSKYDNASDTLVVWVRLTQERYSASLVNPYSKRPYNCYKGIWPRQA